MRTDARVRYTRMVIRNSFVELLKEKPVSRITVKEICERSEINRATFYKHYQDPFDLLEQLENELLAHTREILNQKAYTDITALYIDMLDTLKENEELYRVIGSNHGDHSLYARIFADSYEQVFPLIVRKFPHLDHMSQNLLYYYISHGCSGAVSYWFMNGMREPSEEIAEFINRATLSITNMFSKER